MTTPECVCSPRVRVWVSAPGEGNTLDVSDESTLTPSLVELDTGAQGAGARMPLGQELIFCNMIERLLIEK